MASQNASVSQRKKSPRAAVPVIPLAERAAWSIPEFCALYGFSEATAWRMVKRGEIAVVRYGARTLITREASEAWQRAATVPPRAA